MWVATFETNCRSVTTAIDLFAWQDRLFEEVFTSLATLQSDLSVRWSKSVSCPHRLYVRRNPFNRRSLHNPSRTNAATSPCFKIHKTNYSNPKIILLNNILCSTMGLTFIQNIKLTCKGRGEIRMHISKQNRTFFERVVNKLSDVWWSNKL